VEIPPIRRYADEMLEKLDRTTRLRLLRVLTAAAWVDGEVQAEERAFFEKLLDKFPIPKDEREIAMAYLDEPPHPAEVDPMKIPPEHRETLVKLVREVVGADSTVDPQEQQAVQDLEELLLGH
jgi:uncharacterized tellurite resistance protein B-like protein